MEEKDQNKFYLVVKVSRGTKIRNFFILKFKRNRRYVNE